MKSLRVSFVYRFAGAFGVVLGLAYATAQVHAQTDDGQDESEQAAQDLEASPLIQTFYATTPFFKTVVTNDSAQVFPGPADFVYQDLPGAGPGNGAFAAIAGSGTLLTMRFTAESQCVGGGTDFGWCGLRILVNGVEASPAPADFAFDSTNNGEEGSGSWEGHAMDRQMCVRNPGGTVRFLPVQVQWRVFSTDGNTTAPTFRLDDWSLTIESALSNCVP